MKIDEMGIKLIDEHDIGDYVKQPKVRAPKPPKHHPGAATDSEIIEGVDGEEILDTRVVPHLVAPIREAIGTGR